MTQYEELQEHLGGELFEWLVDFGKTGKTAGIPNVIAWVNAHEELSVVEVSEEHVDCHHPDLPDDLVFCIRL